jgi:hypothetical protein
MTEPTPYLRGVADACAGKPGPAFPKPGSSWSDRLYARGWSDAMDERLRAADGNSYRYHATGLPAGGDRPVSQHHRGSE